MQLESLSSSSLLLVDWFTGGRAARGEHWDFGQLSNVLAVDTADGQPVLRDTLHMAGGAALRQHMGDTTVMATVVLLGPRTAVTAGRLLEAFGTRSESGAGSALAAHDPVVSCSPFGTGCVMRVAASHQEALAAFLLEHVGDLAGELDNNPFAEMLGNTNGVVLGAVDKAVSSCSAEQLAPAYDPYDLLRGSLVASEPTESVPMSPVTQLATWQLLDSSLPTGAFAHSSGLEAAVAVAGLEHLRDEDNLTAHLWAQVVNSATSQLPFVMAGARLADDRALEALLPAWDALDRLAGAVVLNAGARRASIGQGAALLRIVAAMLPDTADLCQALRQPREPADSPAAQLDEARGRLHLAPMFGLAARLIDPALTPDTTALMFLYSVLRALLAAALRLNLVGPMRATHLQHHLGNQLPDLLDRVRNLTPDDAHAVAPKLELYAALHDRLFSRIFNS